MNVNIGEAAPDFTLQDQDGNEWSLSAQRGRSVVLYFYPRDDTSGCTTQACDVRDHWAQFRALDVAVVGISPDDVATHDKFAAKYELPHTLLADPDREAIGAYGAWGTKTNYGRTYEGVLRSSVVIDADGNVAAVFERIQPKQQSEKSLEAVRALGA